MAFPIVFTKQLLTAHAAGIAASQSVSANVAMVLNGSNYTKYLSTTSSAAGAANTWPSVIPMTSTTGVYIGQPVTDSTANVIPQGTVVTGVNATQVVLNNTIGGAGVGSGDTIVFTGPATIDAATAANSAIGRRVVVAYTGTDCNWTVVGTNASGATITDTIVGSSGAGQSNMDFVTVTSITPNGSVTAATAGTNGVGSSPWMTLNADATSTMNVGFSIELVSGSVNFTVQHTYDDPNYLLGGATYPQAINDPNINGATASAEGSYTTPITAIRVLINSGTGEIRMRVLQSSIG
jgi:hypothetical protein